MKLQSNLPQIESKSSILLSRDGLKCKEKIDISVQGPSSCVLIAQALEQKSKSDHPGDKETDKIDVKWTIRNFGIKIRLK